MSFITLTNQSAAPDAPSTDQLRLYAINKRLASKDDAGLVVEYTGDVVGPSSATDNALARFDNSGKLLQNSSVTVDDSGNLSTPGTIDGRATRLALATSGQTGGERLVGVTDTGAPRTITLASADVAEGKLIDVKDESGGAGTNNITVDTQGAETIDGAASIVISVNYGILKLYSDGTNWFTR